MLMGLIGRMGQGKTLTMTAFGSFLAYKTGATLYSRHTVLGSITVNKISQIWEMENAIFLYDEAWVDMDSRDWKNNIDITRWIQQSRKKDLIVMYSVQHYSQIEKRMRKATDILGFCEKYNWTEYKKDILGHIIMKEKTGIKLTIVDAHTGRIFKIIKIKDIVPFFGLYDTYEVIKPLK